MQSRGEIHNESMCDVEKVDTCVNTLYIQNDA